MIKVVYSGDQIRRGVRRRLPILQVLGRRLRAWLAHIEGDIHNGGPSMTNDPERVQDFVGCGGPATLLHSHKWLQLGGVPPESVTLFRWTNRTVHCRRLLHRLCPNTSAEVPKTGVGRRTRPTVRISAERSCPRMVCPAR